ncbi:MAG: oligopeptide/dipeptide ABC transporter ATP-binding protein, partial [Burkholderiales bacterium]
MEKLLEIEGLRTEIDGIGAPTRAVDGISLDIQRGETFALVGESGCGKSMTALSIMRLLPEAGHIAGGAVRVNGTDLLALPESQMRDQRGRRIAMIFQEPATSLNAVMTVGRQIEEVLERHLGMSGEAARARAQNLLEAVGVPDAARRLTEYPFQLSGGLKQRVMIAMALAAEPEILVADEPTTALDVTIQAQVLDLLKKLQAERGMAILLITHDLGIVAGMASRVAVMYAGEIVEIASREDFFSNPQHPYSRKLFASLPGAGRRGEELAVIPGQVPPLNTAFHGCRFADRCEHAHARCRSESPGWTVMGAAATGEAISPHQVRCHWVGDRQKGVESQGQAGAAPKAGKPAEVTHAKTEIGKALLKVVDLKVHFPIRKGVFKKTVGHVKAVDGVSLDVPAGKTLALVGESGCGKTTVGKA